MAVPWQIAVVDFSQTAILAWWISHGGCFSCSGHGSSNGHWRNSGVWRRWKKRDSSRNQWGKKKKMNFGSFDPTQTRPKLKTLKPNPQVGPQPLLFSVGTLWLLNATLQGNFMCVCAHHASATQSAIFIWQIFGWPLWSAFDNTFFSIIWIHIFFNHALTMSPTPYSLSQVW